SDAPKVAGVAPQQHLMSVNGELCQSVVSVSGLLPDMVKAWREFRKVLAGEHAATLPYIPADQHSGCDLALNTFSPEWFLEFGLPVQNQQEAGRGMILIDYVVDEQVDAKLFELPDGYERYSAN
ncbi:MAG: hypothetical protein OQK78_11355, partial [Gammaproteobacteria bacterium]|nr:hypothetical protein [Gammaproteobacteria bacterium]